MNRNKYNIDPGYPHLHTQEYHKNNKLRDITDTEDLVQTYVGPVLITLVCVKFI